MDYFLDLRKDSLTFMQYRKVELTASNRKMVYLPQGVAHGFFTLEDHTELLYHHTTKYVPGADSGIRYNDPRVDIHLPHPVTVISEKDKSYPELTNAFKGIEL
jgi:dTDP-4-dehydrorhamnose 3,5-epimerase